MTANAQGSNHWEGVHRHKEKLLDVGRDAGQRGFLSRPIDWLGRGLSHPVFFLLMAASHGGWLIYNSGWLPVPLIDPYPFTFLATVASVEAPFLSLMILMYQRRKQRVDEVRNETELQIALHDERESTKLLQLVADMHRAMKLSPGRRDAALERMQDPLDVDEIVKEVERDQ
jgi:uncharacterized membrane protein